MFSIYSDYLHAGLTFQRKADGAFLFPKNPSEEAVTLRSGLYRERDRPKFSFETGTAGNFIVCR